MNDDLGTVWKGMVVASIKILYWHLSGGTEENHEKPQSD
jgi:hypothetical protein